jgi:hypothetical protein
LAALMTPVIATDGTCVGACDGFGLPPRSPQVQIKELLRESSVRAKAQQQAAVAQAIGEAEAKAADEKTSVLETARQAVQLASSQMAGQVSAP